MSTRSRLAVLLLTVFVSACGGDAAVAPAPAVKVDLAQVFKELSGSGIQGALAAAGGVVVPSTAGPSACSYSAATLMFVCPPVTTGGHTITMSYSLMNASGATLSQFDATAIAAVRVHTVVSGTETTADGSTSVMDAQQDLTLSGLQTSTHVLNGTNTLNLTGTAKSFGQAGAFTLRSTMSIVNLVLPASATVSSYPTSGTVTMDMVSTFAGAPSLTTLTVMKFNGTSKVTMTITINGTTRPACTVDLATFTTSCA